MTTAGFNLVHKNDLAKIIAALRLAGLDEITLYCVAKAFGIEHQIIWSQGVRNYEQQTSQTIRS